MGSFFFFIWFTKCYRSACLLVSCDSRKKWRRLINILTVLMLALIPHQDGGEVAQRGKVGCTHRKWGIRRVVVNKGSIIFTMKQEIDMDFVNSHD